MLVTFIVGTAGSGKSTLTHAFHEWLEANEVEAITVNLDPAAKWLPYSPDVDVREYVSVEEIMERHNLGPNGAIIAAADMIATMMPSIRDEILGMRPGYVLMDTPGQMELFAFRIAGTLIVSELSLERSVLVFLIDPVLSQSPSGLVSSLLLSASVFYRLGLPQINVLSKCDLFEESLLERIISWIETPISLLGAIERDPLRADRGLTYEVCKLLAETGSMFCPIPTSSRTGEGLPDLYAKLQQIYLGGEEGYLT